MSSISVDAITDINGGNTTSINGTTPNAYNTVGKNLIINGAMQIAQRGTSATSVTASGYKAADRFRTTLGSLGTWTVEQSTDAPDGFSNSLKHSCTTADASPVAAGYCYIETKLEGQALQQLAKGTTSANKVTLSFWVKCNKTGDMQVNLRDFDNNRMISNTITISSADTWEKKSLTFVGDTTGALDNDNEESLRLEFWLDSGSDWSSGAVPTSWETRDNTDRNAGGTLALADSTSNYINITGVQLEVGESATEFEHRPYTTEELLCFRYFYKHATGFVTWIYPIANTTNTQYRRAAVFYKVRMRANPTCTTVLNSGNTPGHQFQTTDSVTITRDNAAASDIDYPTSFQADAEL